MNKKRESNNLLDSPEYWLGRLQEAGHTGARVNLDRPPTKREIQAWSKAFLRMHRVMIVMLNHYQSRKGTDRLAALNLSGPLSKT